MARTLALTGATGFIGSALLPRLIASGWRVRALFREGGTRRAIDAGAVEWVPGALEDPASLQRLVHGADAVVHCAGRVRAAAAAEFERVNVGGVMRMARAAAAQDPPPRLLLMSSLAAREPALSPYAASKHRGEEALFEVARAATRPAPWAVLRPPAVYGPGDRDVLPLMRWMGRGLGLVLGPPGARFSLLHVDDLADAVCRWLETDPPATGVFELHDGAPGGYGWEELLERVARVRGRRVRCVRVPAAALRALAYSNLALARLLGYAPMLNPGKLRELRHSDWVCDNCALTRATGWRPQVPLEEGLRRILGWTSIGDDKALSPSRRVRGGGGG